MKFISGMFLGAVLTVGTWTVAAQPIERALHPRLSRAITALQDARAYMQEAPHDFGGHKVAAIEACDRAIEQIRLALAYRGERDRR
ncbi:MAG: hypothetical protein JO323_26390 [Acidobacteriia bacterium]|nr:hypothetical protein [Terriglobia bacterium]